MSFRFVVALLSVALGAAGPAASPKEIPWPAGSEEALVVPASSPLRFAGFDENQVAHFRGRIILSGIFVYGCDIECEPPVDKDDLTGSFIPDVAAAARLPNWKHHYNDMRISLTDGDRLAAEVVTPAERAAIYAGKVDNVRKHVSIVIEDFTATLECDSASYGATYIELVKPPEIETAGLDGNYGCGWI